MATAANATFRITSWNEEPHHDAAGVKLTRAHVTKSFDGDLEAESSLTYLMMHRSDGTASFVGLELVTGRLAGREGSFVLEHRGTFENGVATARWTVLPRSGSGELEGLTGEGGFSSGHADEYAMTLEYDVS